MRYRIVSTGDSELPYAIKFKYRYWPFWFWLRNSYGDWTPRAGCETIEEAKAWIANQKAAPTLIEL